MLAALPGIFLMLGGSVSVRAQEGQSFPVNENNGSSVEVTHIFSAVPPGGYTAVRVTVINKGKEALSVLTGSESFTPCRDREHSLKGPPATIDCPPESTTTREIIVPLMTDFSVRSSYQDNQLAVNLTVSGRQQRAVFRNEKKDGLPFWGISQSVGGASATPLNEAAKGKSGTSSSSYRGGGRFAGSFLPAHLPSDWRAYTGLDGLAMSPEDWNTLLPGVRTAIRQWIMLGGALDLYHNGPAPAGILEELKAEAGSKGLHALGAGFVRPVRWDGVVLDEYDLGPFRAPGVGVRHGAARDSMGKGEIGTKGAPPGAGLPLALEARSFAAWQVGLILLIFGILVGPVNLFYLAAPGRRHRLFFTTPLIALGASVVLITVIFLQDGAGGMGQRAAVIELHPDENLSAVRQYQISRTGVLFGGGFVMEQPAVLTPLLLEPSRWTRLKPADASESEPQRFNVPEPQAYAGDWFQSRSEQAQLVESLRPGRGRVELKPGSNPPVLSSSLTGSLEQVFYLDPAGQWWSGNAVLATGGSLALQKSTLAEFETWLRKQAEPFPPAVRNQLTGRNHAGRFYAVSHDPQAGFLGTLSAINWQNDHALIHGRLAPVP